jgi:hypothetical protein
MANCLQKKDEQPERMEQYYGFPDRQRHCGLYLGALGLCYFPSQLLTTTVQGQIPWNKCLDGLSIHQVLEQVLSASSANMLQ